MYSHNLTLPNFCVVLCIVYFVSFCVLFVCICVLYYCHQMATQLQLTNISYHITTLSVESTKHYIFRVCVCSLSYPASKMHKPYHIVICDLSGSTTFATLSHQQHDFFSNLNIKRVLIFCTTFD